MRSLRLGVTRVLAGLLTGAALLASIHETCAMTAPATIAYVEGVVLVKRRGEDKPVRAELGMSLFYGDQVRTLAGKCQVNMTASGILRLSPNTTVLFPEEENSGDKISVMRMLGGKTRTNLWKLYEEISVDVSVFWEEREIERVRAEGNALLDAIRAELQTLEGKPLDRPCPNNACGSVGPHRWTPDGWECACGATVLRLSEFPTAHGAYGAVRASYRQRIQELEEKVARMRDSVGQDLEVRNASLTAGTQG
jgi:hypothetical protein